MMGGEQVDLTNYVKHNNFKHCAGADYVPVYNQYNFDPTPIRKALGIERNSTDADWEEWIYKLSLCVLKHSPSIWYQTCYMLAVEHVPLAETLFNESFLLVWDKMKTHHIPAAHLEALFNKICTKLGIGIGIGDNKATDKIIDVPKSVLQKLLDVIEHIERVVGIKSADIDFATLGNMAIKSQAYAKALYYKEYEFRTNPADSTKDLVDINQALDQPDAAKGVIMKTNDLSFDSMGENPRVRFFVSLSQWENALEK